MVLSEFLQRVYAGVSDEGLVDLSASHSRVHLKKGETLSTAGSAADAYMCVTNGLLRSFVIDASGADQTTDFFEPGTLAIDVVSLFLRRPSVETVLAVTECVGYVISYTEFQTLFHKHESIREWGRAWMSKQHLMLKQRMLDSYTKTALERYSLLAEERPYVMLHASHRSIASYLGLNESTLSRLGSKMVAPKDGKSNV